MPKQKVIPLRQRQVQLSKDTILDISYKLFKKNGFSSTTIQEIADATGMGTATVFRHFRSKLGLFTALVERDLEPIFSEGWKLLEEIPDDPVDALMIILENFFNLLDAPSKMIRAELYNKSQFDFNKPEINELTRKADEVCTEQIRAVLQKQSEKDRLNPDINLDEMADIIFEIFNHHYYIMTRTNRPRKSEVVNGLRRKVTIIFQSWYS